VSLLYCVCYLFYFRICFILLLLDPIFLRTLTLKKERNGSVSFGNDNSSKIIEKDTVKIGNKDAMAENVLLVENMKHILLSLSQMCDQGHTLIFKSKKCEIRK
jgi:hypothetical protein